MADKASNIPVKSASMLSIADGKPNPSAVNETFKVILDANGFGRGPAFPVGHSGIVRIRGHNGTLAGNTNIVAVGKSRESVSGATGPAGLSSADYIPIGSEINYPCNNLAELWFYGSGNDGVIISVRGVI